MTTETNLRSTRQNSHQWAAFLHNDTSLQLNASLPHSSSLLATTYPQSGSTATGDIVLSYLQRVFRFIGQVILKIKGSSDKWTITGSVLIGIAFGVPAWLGLRLKTRTSKKGHYMLCFEEMMDIVRTVLTQYRHPVKIGLSPIPLEKFRHSLSTGLSFGKRSLASKMRFIGHNNAAMRVKRVAAPESGRFWVTGGQSWLYIICISFSVTFVSIIVTGQRTAARKRISRRTHHSRAFKVLLACILASSLLSILLVYTVVELRSKWRIAGEGHLAYCYADEDHAMNTGCPARLVNRPDLFRFQPWDMLDLVTIGMFSVVVSIVLFIIGDVRFLLSLSLSPTSLAFTCL
ncbi:hypothetical protein C7974DRAFT_405446 [Boeremia exigua]|uniref:uncharacterized protein n=1 Tax=Boeremia exigua TaxID=749465 RepID=UPI001E8E71EA|nr:uncharacterized protein C7974DRAFT_405446 [Boeremia exigua]KAH6612373.1 hypothetical protein C7974DRAFT_405446 [Boeremia exigua]